MTESLSLVDCVCVCMTCVCCVCVCVCVCVSAFVCVTCRQVGLSHNLFALLVTIHFCETFHNCRRTHADRRARERERETARCTWAVHT